MMMLMPLFVATLSTPLNTTASTEAFATTSIASDALAPAAASSSSLLWHYLGTIGSYTALVVVGLLLLAMWLKKRPQLLEALKGLAGLKQWLYGGSATPEAPAAGLTVLEHLQLEADKALYVVAYHNQRFLISSGGTEGLRFLAPVQPHQDALSAWQNQVQASPAFAEETASLVANAALAAATPMQDEGQARTTMPQAPNASGGVQPAFLNALRGMLPNTPASSAPPVPWAQPNPTPVAGQRPTPLTPR
jgi:hypothetical protein